MAMPLWLRTAIAIAILFATASSSYLVFALLIIPQAILNWSKKMISTTLNRLGITKLVTTLWKFIVPDHLQHKWYMHSKWTMGRRQVATARKLKEKIANRKQQAPGSGKLQAIPPSNKLSNNGERDDTR